MRAELKSGLERARRAWRGFTLTELLVVIAIIMGLAAASAPALAAFRRGQRLDHATRLVQSAMNDARRQAITLRARHVVVFYSFEETAGQLDTIRHAIAIYREPTGVKPGTPGAPRSVTDGYWPGGFVGKELILPANIRFRPDLMENRVFQGKPDPEAPGNADFFRAKLRGERADALAFRRDGTIEERIDAPANEGGTNIFLHDEGCYAIPDGRRGDVVIVETAGVAAGATPVEAVSKGKRRRGYVDLNLQSGRATARVFDIGERYEYLRQQGGGS